MKFRWLTVSTCLLLLSGTANSEPTTFSLTVVGARADDPRWVAVEEAVAFWNRELGSAEAQARLGRIARRLEPVDDHALRAISNGILRRGWVGSLPENLRRIPGDIIIVFSDEDLVSFGLPRRGGRGGLIGLRRADVRPLSLRNVLRNVVAHELGHMLGLGHNTDPTMLMCGRPATCRPDSFFSTRDYFFPLTPQERADLRRWW